MDYEIYRTRAFNYLDGNKSILKLARFYHHQRHFQPSLLNLINKYYQVNNYIQKT